MPHELTHALQTSLSAGKHHAASERLANDLEVEFYQEQAGGPDQLDHLAQVIEALLAHLLALPPVGDAYFNLHYGVPVRRRMPHERGHL